MKKNRILSLQLNIALLLLCMKSSAILGFGSAMVVVVENGSNNVTTTKCIERERQSLLMFKESLIDRYRRLSSWGSEEDKKECCKWSGVHCSNRNGHVIMLNLSAPYSSKLKHDSTLRGTFNSPSLLELRHLRYLDLSYNDFGSTPIPKFIGSLPKLKYLDLSHASFGGFLPNALGQLSNLEHLDVSFNSLRGVISDAHFLNLSKLKYLDLSVNTFALELSSQWISPFQLDTIILASCVLGPRFPKWLQTQTKISHLNLSNGGISDNIPTWFWNQSTGLQFLDLSSNKLRGMLPDLSLKFVGYPLIDLSSNYFVGPVPPLPSSLEILNLSRNKFSGRLSFLYSITNWTLTFLDLSDNLFSGGLPGCFELFQKLIILNLGNNKLSGKLPSYASSSLSRLETLVLHNNSFFGEFPSTFRHSTFLKFMDLSGNKLSGNIPAWIGGNLPKLYVLSLRSNKFNGSIPLQLCHLTKLQILDLSLNSLSGSIPRCFDNFTAMSQHSIENVPSRIHSGTSSYVDDSYINSILLMWKGRLNLFQNRILSILCVIDLSCNKLTGDLPEEITSLKGLDLLNVSSNQLCGVIPPKIGRMENLESLDLSNNKFSGEIPLGMANLNFVSHLDLSNNNLSGRIPLGTLLQSLDTSAYEGNSRLCGSPLEMECRKDDAIIGGGNEFGARWFYMVIALGFSTGFWEIVANYVLFNHHSKYMSVSSFSPASKT